MGVQIETAHCPECGHDIDVIVHYKRTWLIFIEIDYDWQYVRCSSCGVEFRYRPSGA